MWKCGIHFLKPFIHRYLLYYYVCNIYYNILDDEYYYVESDVHYHLTITDKTN